jgi:glucuronate isomerase
MQKTKVPATVTPAMRPDRGYNLADLAQWNNWVEALSRETGKDETGKEDRGKVKREKDETEREETKNDGRFGNNGPGNSSAPGTPYKKTPEDFSGFISLLEERCRQFHALGCRLSDHAVEKPVAEKWTVQEVDRIYKKARRGETLSNQEEAEFSTAFLSESARINRKLGWTMQLHIGALRSINSRMFKQLGPDTGFDAVGDLPIARDLAGFLDLIEKNAEGEGGLPKMIIYPLNPKDNPVIASIIGAFQRDPIPGKLQLGSAWWFNDHIDGMTEQMKTLANIGLLSRFVGMVTDSRSFLSYPRHEYFRRILCGILGTWIAQGQAPPDSELMGGMARDISYRNAVDFFGIPGIE